LLHLLMSGCGTKLNCRFTPPGSGHWVKADLMQSAVT
jgi:hypothetical protein